MIVVDAKWWASGGLLLIAAAYVRLGMVYGEGEWGVSFWISAVGLLVAAVGMALGARPRFVAGGGLALASLAALNVVRLAVEFPSWVDLVALTGVALGLVAMALRVSWSRSAAWSAHAVLAGAAGGATYLVHDVAKGFTGQYFADACWLIGFVLVWIGHRPRR